MFFTTVNPIFVDLHTEVEYELAKPRIAVYKNNWNICTKLQYICGDSRVWYKYFPAML